MHKRKSAGHKGTQGKEADYMVLQSFDEISQSSNFHDEDDGSNNEKTRQGFYDAKENVYEMTKMIEDEAVNSPIKFIHRDGPDKLRSRSFLRALNRCRDLNAVQEEKDQLRLTDIGESLIENLQNELSDQFTTAVEEASEQRRERSE